MCHFETRSLVSAFDVESFVGFGAVEDRLNVSCQQWFENSEDRGC